VKPIPTVDLDRAHALMMGALDGECTAEERQELDSLLARHADLAAEWTRLRRVKEVTASMNLRHPSEETWDRFRLSVMHRAERGIAWTLIAAGAIVLGMWLFWEWLESFLTDAGLPLPVKLAVTGLVAGGLILLVSVIRERWFLRRRDPYSREVTR